MDANRYATKKTIAQGMLDIALCDGGRVPASSTSCRSERSTSSTPLMLTLDLGYLDRTAVNAEEDERSKSLLTKINLYFFGYLLWSTAGVWTNIAFLFNGQFKLPFFPWLLGIPYGKHLPYNYNFLLFYQLTGIWIHAVLNVIVDSQVGYLLAVAGIQMDFLAARLETTQAGRIGQQKFRNTYKQHIKHFNVVNNFVKNVERVYSKSVFSQFCASGITICAIAYRLSSVNFAKEFSTVLPIGIYLLSMLNQIFLHCYFGNEVTLKSSRLTNALYSSEWYKMAPKDRKNVVLMMTRSIRPITVKAGGFFHYNLHSFSWLNFTQDFPNALTSLLYLILMMNQIFMPCYFGNEVTLKSARLTHALYSSEWIKMNAPERKEIQMMMIRSMKPIVLKAGGFFYYNLGMFTSVRYV
ncbi:hypothetical protein pipiens_011643 [Culex pipiens pipiens]|uniref:Odorant receptor n=1 Tax=Culex pipiens pipiens TaxID=38569 RepID=A0ABD1D8M5_CULPP